MRDKSEPQERIGKEPQVSAAGEAHADGTDPCKPKRQLGNRPTGRSPAEHERGITAWVATVSTAAREEARVESDATVQKDVEGPLAPRSDREARRSVPRGTDSARSLDRVERLHRVAPKLLESQ